MGVVRLRLARFGCRNKLLYRIVAADGRSRRDGKHIEILGYYNPLPNHDGGKRMGLNFDKVKYWLGIGAQPSDPVQRLLFRAGLLPPPPMLAMSQKPRRIWHNINPLSCHHLPKDANVEEQLDPDTTEVLEDIEKLSDESDLKQ